MNAKVLILDDDAPILELMLNVFRTVTEVGHIHTAQTVGEALALLSENDYDIILSDIHLVDGNDASGIAFVENLLKTRGDKYRRKIMVFSADYEKIEDAAALGVTVLKKPFELAEFRSKLSKIIPPAPDMPQKSEMARGGSIEA